MLLQNERGELMRDIIQSHRALMVYHLTNIKALR